MTREELLQAIRTLVIAATGLDARRVVEYQPPSSGTRPPLPYVSVHLLNPGKQLGRDGSVLTTTENDDGTFVAEVTGQRDATVSLGAYGVEGYDLLEAVRHVRSHETLRALQRTLHLAVRRVGDVLDTTVDRDGTRFEKQATLTMTVGYVARSTEDLSAVETVAVSAEDGSDLDIADFSFEVTE